MFSFFPVQRASTLHKKDKRKQQPMLQFKKQEQEKFLQKALGQPLNFPLFSFSITPLKFY